MYVFRKMIKYYFEKMFNLNLKYKYMLFKILIQYWTCLDRVVA